MKLQKKEIKNDRNKKKIFFFLLNLYKKIHFYSYLYIMNFLSSFLIKTYYYYN